MASERAEETDLGSGGRFWWEEQGLPFFAGACRVRTRLPVGDLQHLYVTWDDRAARELMMQEIKGGGNWGRPESPTGEGVQDPNQAALGGRAGVTRKESQP